MIQKISKDLFAVKIPLPGTPLGKLNAYVIRSPERNLIIDTGLDRDVCRKTMFKALEKLKVDLSRTDIFLTHHHADHIGLVDDLITENTVLYCHGAGWEILKNWKGFGPLVRFAQRQGFPSGTLQEAFKGHPGNSFRLKWRTHPRFVSEGDIIETGDYRLICTATPGHSKDHMCLYEPSRKILFSGDHILADISPNIQSWSDEGNPLKDYLQSLKKISAMDISLVFPAHRGFIDNHRRRIEELMVHHRFRLEQIMDILSGQPLTAYQVASQMTWHIKGDSWQDFPIEQRWFALVEAIAHLKFLESERRLKSMVSDDLIFYGADNSLWTH